MPFILPFLLLSSIDVAARAADDRAVSTEKVYETTITAKPSASDNTFILDTEKEHLTPSRSKKNLDSKEPTTSIGSLMAQLPSAGISEAGASGTRSLSLRGARSEHTLVLFDSLELNDPSTPSAGADLSWITLEGVSSMTLSPSPEPVLYGSDAMGGVLLIEPDSPKGRARAHAGASFGSYDTFHEFAAFRQGGRNAGAAIDVMRIDSSGFSSASARQGNSEVDGRMIQSGALRGYFNFTPDFQLKWTTRASQSEADLDLFGGPGGDDVNYTQSSSLLHGLVQIESRPVRSRWKHALSLSWNRMDRVSANEEDPDHPGSTSYDDFTSTQVRVKLHEEWTPSQHQTLGAKIDAQNESALGLSEFTSPGFPASLQDFEAKRNRLGISAWHDGRWSGGWHGFEGVRMELEEESSPHLALQFRPSFRWGGVESDEWQIYAQGSDAIRSPTLYQRFSVYGSPDLQRERLLALEAGLSSKRGLSASIYRHSYRQLIDFDFSQSRYVNTSRALVHGAELRWDHQPTDSLWSWSAAVEVMEARDPDSGLALPRRAPLRTVLAPSRVIYANAAGQATVGLEGMFVGNRRDLTLNGETTLTSYFLLHASSAWPLTKSFAVKLRFDNLLNEEYETISGYGTPGRSFTLGVNATL